MQDFFDSPMIRMMGIKCGDGCLLHKTALVYNPENLELGENVRIDAYTVISCGQGKIRIGSFTHVSSFCLFIGAFGICLGQFCGIAAGSKLYSASDRYDGDCLIGPMVPREQRLVVEGPVLLEDFTSVAVNCTVMPKSTLGEGSVLLANSVLMGTAGPMNIYSGTPAKRIRPRRTTMEALRALAQQVQTRQG